MHTGTYLVLGQLYSTMGRAPEAEAAFRKAIAVTLDPAKNDYEVERAHFWLGRLLLQNSSPAEGRKELDTSRDLLYFKAKQTELKLHGSRIIQSPLDKTHEADPEDLAQLKEFESKVGPLIASSYDNLGVHAAIAGDYASAASYFAHSAQWNPVLNGVDMNWGRAAFAAKKYAEAVEPLERTLALHPGDEDVRSMLGISYYMTHDYTSTLRVLQPIEGKVSSSPFLMLAYDGATALAGDYELGLARLQALEGTHPESAIVHCLLGEAFAIKGHYDQSAEELRTALRLDEANADAKYALSLTDKALGEKGEAQRLLTELAQSGSSDGAVFYQLGLLQMDAGEYKDAAVNLETAIRLSPMNGVYHHELANAYRKDGRPDDADHEAQQADLLQAQSVAGTNQRTKNQESLMSTDRTATIQRKSSQKGVDSPE
jgi:tetratricopeptide (TPR) repeat protein